MIHFTDATGLAGNALAIVAVSSRMLRRLRLSPARPGWLLAAIFVAVLIPFGNIPLAGYLRGAIGDLSISSLLLLITALLRVRSDKLILPGRGKWLLLIALTAIPFYPMALGWGSFDPYRLGYGNLWFIGSLFVFSLVAALRRLPMVACAIALPVLMWSAGWYESGNLWDYLLDPLVAIYALAASVKYAAGKLRHSSPVDAPPHP
jgi:hypothetical protein